MENVVACTLLESPNMLSLTLRNMDFFPKFFEILGSLTQYIMDRSPHTEVHLFLSCISDVLIINRYNLIDKNILL